MTALPEIFQRSLRIAGIMGCIAASAIAAQSQTAISFLPSVNVRLSTNGAGYGSSAIAFSTSKQSLTCPSSGIVAKVTSTTDGTGLVLVDNFINLTLTQGTTVTGPTNICTGGIVENGNQQDCFTSGYQVPASEGNLTNQDPDGTIAAEGGVGPLDISTMLVGGVNTIQLDAVDTGGYLASSSVYLYTNCTPNGAVGGGTVSGNPVTTDTSTQTFPFSTADNLNVQFLLDLSNAFNGNTIILIPGSTPSVADAAFDPTMWPSYVHGTSFSTSQCLVHNGELQTNGLPGCKLYTLTCQIGQGSNASGVQCPTSTSRNIVIQDIFDPLSALSLPDIHTSIGGVPQVFHQGFGFLEAAEGWLGGPCTFDPDADQFFSCPENLLTLFTGPGIVKPTGTPEPGFNSDFISVGPVPEPRTDINLNGFENGKWLNRHQLWIGFVTTPPSVPAPNNDFVPSPIYGVTYGVSLASELPSTEFPVPGDITLLDQNGCGKGVDADPFHPGQVKVTVPLDGQYLIHYFSTDCAGTEELKFFQDASQSWQTTFYTAQLNVDTVPPKVILGPILNPPPTLIHGEYGYCRHQVVTATYQCSDTRSGVQRCGEEFYPHPIKYPNPVTFKIDTNLVGQKMYTVNVWDAATNQGAPESVAYSIIDNQFCTP